MGRPNKEDSIYTAGLFDGEGSIIVQVEQPGSRRKSPCHRLEVVITNTDLSVINWLKESFGGYISKHSEKHDNVSESWRWRIACNEATAFLERILPYLKIKRKQAIMAIMFGRISRIHGVRLTEAQISEREQFKYDISSLAQRNGGM